MSDPVQAALALWGLAGAEARFVAGRENRVFRIRANEQDLALRLKRPGYRSDAELLSELQWMQAMGAAGLQVPQPQPSLSGKMLERVGEQRVDILSWLPGQVFAAADTPETPAIFAALGREMARLHTACDLWVPPPGFTRCAWDLDGLLGEAPLWGRFWDNPNATAPQRAMLSAFRDMARGDLALRAPALDYGLIHADLVPDNIHVSGGQIALLDFDDGGMGFRVFELATFLLKCIAQGRAKVLISAFISGYQSLRALDIDALDLFIALRATTYVGWIVPRMGEAGAEARSRRFLTQATDICGAYLEGRAILTL